VACLIPVAALFYGAAFLDDAFTPCGVVGLALILGVAGVTGALRLTKRFCRELPTHNLLQFDTITV
jgi:drug/metabolite transporter (DMT)-like permease